MNLLRESDIERDQNRLKMISSLGYFYRAPDCYIIIYVPTDEKHYKNADYPGMMKSWIDLRNLKKQDWVLVIYFDITKSSDLANEVIFLPTLLKAPFIIEKT